MRHALLVLLALLVIGCISTDVQLLEEDGRPARSPDSLAVLDEAPETPHTVIAVVESRSDAVFKSFEDLRTALLAEAAMLGGDALILGPETTESTVIFTPTMILSERKQLTAQVIVFE